MLGRILLIRKLTIKNISFALTPKKGKIKTWNFQDAQKKTIQKQVDY